MSDQRIIHGFSKLSREKKIKIISELIVSDNDLSDVLDSHLHPDKKIQDRYNDFSENTISNYHLPYGIAPNFLINEEIYHIPMVTEESSVIAAASSAAKFWSTRGGFIANVQNTIKTGQVHFTWTGNESVLNRLFMTNKERLLGCLKPVTVNMEARGGGILDIDLLNKKNILENYYQLFAEFKTADAMGANFINTCLELLAHEWQNIIEEQIQHTEGSLEIIMSILSNFTPECIVKAGVQCRIADLDGIFKGISGKDFAVKFVQAVKIAENDVYRAVTHNKGIFNGIDAVILASGNDFRATEACGHAYASSGGNYRSLSGAELNNNEFSLELTLPLALGTAGGITNIHPLARKTLEILGNPSAAKLMMISASAGLANNFSAVRALITSGIQEGHMRMHLSNLLNIYNPTREEKILCAEYFRNKPVTSASVGAYIEQLRNK